MLAWLLSAIGMERFSVISPDIFVIASLLTTRDTDRSVPHNAITELSKESLKVRVESSSIWRARLA